MNYELYTAYIVHTCQTTYSVSNYMENVSTHTTGYTQSFEPHVAYMCTCMYTEGIHNYVVITLCVQTFAGCYLENVSYMTTLQKFISANASILFTTLQPLKYSSIIEQLISTGRFKEYCWLLLEVLTLICMCRYHVLPISRTAYILKIL